MPDAIIDGTGTAGAPLLVNDANAAKTFLSSEDGNPIGPGNRLYNNNLLLEVSKGNIPGHSFIRKFGSVDDLGADIPTDVYEFGATTGAENYTFSADGVADITTMSSSNASDNELITIVGLDIDGFEVIQSKNLNGQNKVTLDTPLWRVNRVFNGGSTDLLGDLYVYVDGIITNGIPNDVTTVRGYISQGNGQSLQTIYTVPAGKTAYFYGFEASLTKGIGATIVNVNFSGYTREFGKVFRIQDEFNLVSSGTSARNTLFAIPISFPGKTDFLPKVISSVSGVGVSWAFTLLLVDN